MSSTTPPRSRPGGTRRISRVLVELTFSDGGLLLACTVRAPSVHLACTETTEKPSTARTAKPCAQDCKQVTVWLVQLRPLRGVAPGKLIKCPVAAVRAAPVPRTALAVAYCTDAKLSCAGTVARRYVRRNGGTRCGSRTMCAGLTSCVPRQSTHTHAHAWTLATR